MKDERRTFFLETYGCQMNEHDSERLAGVLAAAGYRRVEDPAKAGVILLNTCAVREKPEHKVYSRLGELRKRPPGEPEPVLAVCGCVAQIRGKALLERLPYVDLVVGTGALSELPSLLSEAYEGRRTAQVDFVEPPSALWELAERTSRVSAYLTIMRGCNNFCSYCVVPFARGRETSRPKEEILAEARALLDQGYHEVVLLGQNVNSYAHDLQAGYDFCDLLYELSELPGLKRLRFTTSHPKDVPERLIRAMAELEPVCPHFHLAVQSGSDRVLKAMNRNYTAARFEALVQRLREAVPEIALTTDVIVGFPGETEADFELTYELFKRIRFDQAFMFEYSDRPGTRAFQLQPKVPRAEKNRRLKRLAALQNEISRDLNQAQVGRTFEVLVEGPRPGRPGQLQGRTPQHKLMLFDGPESLTGEFVQVTAREAFLWGFKGELVRR